MAYAVRAGKQRALHPAALGPLALAPAPLPWYCLLSRQLGERVPLDA